MTLVEALISFLGEGITAHKHELFEKILENRTHFVQLGLDALEDPLDANAALRTSECFGIQKVHWLQSPDMRKLKRGVAVGSSKWLELQLYDLPLRRLGQTFKDKGMRQFAVSTRPESMPIAQIPLDQPLVLWFASERSGFTQDPSSFVDGFVRLPMQGIGRHVNFSVAVALACQEVTNALKRQEQPWQLSERERQFLRLEWYATIPKKRRELVTRFLAERGLGMNALAPPVTSQRFWNMMQPGFEI